MTRSKMGQLGKLSQFSGIQPPSTPPTPSLESTNQQAITSPASAVEQPEKKQKLVTINIKIARNQHEWLSQTARTVRENNSTPVAPTERVFPQHLIGIAIELLQTAEVDWSQIQSTEDLRRQLSLIP